MKAHIGVDAVASVASDPHLSKVEYRVAARQWKLAALAQLNRPAKSRKASVRAKIENQFLIVLLALANPVMRAGAVALMG